MITIDDEAQRTFWIYQRHLCVPHYYSPFLCINTTHMRQRRAFRKTEPAESCPFVTQRNMRSNETVGHSAGICKLPSSGMENDKARSVGCSAQPNKLHWETGCVLLLQLPCCRDLKQQFSVGYSCRSTLAQGGSAWHPGSSSLEVLHMACRFTWEWKQLTATGATIYAVSRVILR